MNVLLITVSLIFGAVLGGFIILKFNNRRTKSDEELLKLSERMEMANRIWSEQFKELRTEITSARREEIEIRERSSKDIHQQAEKFVIGIAQISEVLKQMDMSVKEVSNFQEIFKSPKLRGGWGETSLENLLREYLGDDLYLKQHQFKSGEMIDFAAKLPNGLLLPIDSKFPAENFQKMVEIQDEKEKLHFRKLFIDDVKKHVDAIASKYILPAESTVDVALMFIPAEAIYYEIINGIKEADLSEYAAKKRVMLTSPNTLRLHWVAINHWFRDMQFNKKTKDVLKQLQQIASDGFKLNESFRVLGRHITETQGAYNKSEERLKFLVDRVDKVGNLINVEEPKELK